MLRTNPAVESVLVTGAAVGFGRDLAREFARRGHPVILVAPVAAEVHEAAAAIARETGTPVLGLARDLRLPGTAEAIFTHLEGCGVFISILVNNSSYGCCGNFWELSSQQDREMIQVNIESSLRLTKLFLPGMIARGRGRILNISSVGGFEPAPLLAVYHATKAFIVSWSEALAAELQDSGVTVTALCPGAVDPGSLAEGVLAVPRGRENGQLLSPEAVALAGVEATMRGQRVSVPALDNLVARSFSVEPGEMGAEVARDRGTAGS